MTRDQVVATAITEGWRAWGRARPQGRQCYRRGNKYTWIVARHVTRNHNRRNVAIDYVSAHPTLIREMLSG